MKKYCSILLLVVFICCSCSIRRYDPPNEGIFYCDKLRMTIDFSKSANENGVEVILDDGQVAVFACQIDYGTGVFITNLETLERYIMGHFKYKDDIFYIITEDETYHFFRIQE